MYSLKSGENLCSDFGLSRVKANATCHIARQDGGVIVGGHNWMAPERLRGGSLKGPSDIYSFGMILGKVSAGMCLSSMRPINVMGLYVD